MPIFKCKVINQLGAEKKMTVEGVDLMAVKAKLVQNNLLLVSAKEVKDKKKSEFFTMSFGVKPAEVIMFLRQFSVMINATISISDSLFVLKNMKYSSTFRDILETVYKDVVSGTLLSGAFAKHPKIFPAFFIEMVQIGELSGSLDTVSSSMADYYENDQKIKKKAKSSMVYPTLLLVMIMAVIIFMSFFILPRFKNMFAEFGGNIPQITKVVFAISDFVNAYFMYIAAGIFVITGGLWVFFREKAGKKVKDWLGLNLPVIGKVNNAVVTARFTRAFVILLKSGMNITDCLSNLVGILGNEIYAEKFAFAIEEVKRGKFLATALQKTGIFPAMVTEMVSVGEKSGNLEEVLSSNASYFDSQVDSSIASAIALMEPLIIIILGFVVAIVLLSVYIPMIELMGQI